MEASRRPPGFEQAARQYAEQGIATFPLGGESGKKPLVGGPQRFGVKGSLDVATQFPEANVGFWCGPRSGLTVVDIDLAGDLELEWSLKEFGPSPVVVRTGSGKHHIYYRHDSEGRRLNCVPGHKIDLLGSGVCVAPPSVRPGGGEYTFIRGGLADLKQLPTIQKGALDLILRPDRLQHRLVGDTPVVGLLAPQEGTVERRRNNTLFAFAREQAALGGEVASLIEALRNFNRERLAPPFQDKKIIEMAERVWRYKRDGHLMLPGRQKIVLDDMAIVERLLRNGDARALMMLVTLKAAHGGKNCSFAASPAAMERAHTIGSWGKKSYQYALATLCEIGALERIARGGRGEHDPAQYVFPGRGGQSDPQSNLTPIPLPLPPSNYGGKSEKVAGSLARWRPSARGTSLFTAIGPTQTDRMHPDLTQ